MARLGTESAFEVLARARAIEEAGGKIIHLEIGEPDFPTAPHIVEAAVEALRAGATHYVPAPGILPLRQAVAAFLERTGRMRVTPDRVVVTPGAKPIMFFTILALANEGDEVLYPDPGFPMYESITSFAGAVPVPVPLRERNGFRVDTDELERLITDRSKLLIINSPHNPCGSALTRQDCETIAAIAQRHDLTVLTDEVYWAIRYGHGSDSPGGHPAPPGTPRTPWPGTPRGASVLDVDGMADRTILLDGWSKTFAMTGWRLGFGVSRPPWSSRSPGWPSTRCRARPRSASTPRSPPWRARGIRSRRWWPSSAAAGTSSWPALTTFPASAASSRRARSTSSRTSPRPGGPRRICRPGC